VTGARGAVTAVEGSPMSNQTVCVHSVVSCFVADAALRDAEVSWRVTRQVARVVSFTTGVLREDPWLHSERDELRRGWRLTGEATACLGGE
jgi:hypothetical protein